MPLFWLYIQAPLPSPYTIPTLDFFPCQVEGSPPGQSKVLEVRSQALRAQLETQNKRINELITALEGALSKIDQNEASLRAEIEKKSAELANLKSEMAAVTAKAAAPTAALESKNAEISRLRAALAAAQAGGTGSVPLAVRDGAAAPQRACGAARSCPIHPVLPVEGACSPPAPDAWGTRL